MKVCILAPFKVLPQMSGASRRVVELCTSLSAAGVSIILLHAGSTHAFHRDLRMIGFPSLENSLLTKHFPVSGAVDTYLSSMNPALCRTLIKLMTKVKIDILQLEGPWSVLAAELANVVASKVPMVYDSHNVESLSVRFSSSVGWMWPFAKLLERRAVMHSAKVFCVSELEKARMCSLYGFQGHRVIVVPNGVCNSEFRTRRPSQIRTRIRTRLQLALHSKIVFFHGELGWKPNAQAAETIVGSIAPRFDKEDREIVFLIAGPHPSRQLLQQSRCHSNVRILGYVPNITEFVCAADLCIAPLAAGSGTRLKILEYFAAGKPVVATHKAVEGLGVVDGIHGLFCKTLGEEFIQAISVALNPELSRELGARARTFAKRFEWSTIAQKVAEVYESLMLH